MIAGTIPPGPAGDFDLLVPGEPSGIFTPHTVTAVRRLRTPRGGVVQFTFGDGHKAVSVYADEDVRIIPHNWGRLGPNQKGESR